MPNIGTLAKNQRTEFNPGIIPIPKGIVVYVEQVWLELEGLQRQTDRQTLPLCAIDTTIKPDLRDCSGN